MSQVKSHLKKKKNHERGTQSTFGQNLLYVYVFYFIFPSFFFFFFPFLARVQETIFIVIATVHVHEQQPHNLTFQSFFRILVVLVYCLWDPQISLFSNFFIKNGSNDTIHTFKIYFATVFSIFSFQFQQNKFYPNGPLGYVW